ncbi:MAG: AAA family ATPase, partial [Bacteriovoracaceae bacterium]|nr:AAA family ATPase [Bacteriovoracaceae bacterium]
MEFLFAGLGLAIVTVVLVFIFKSKKAPTPIEISQNVETKPAVVSGPSWTDRLTSGLSRARQDVWGKLAQALGRDDSSMEAAEEILYAADLPPALVADLLEELGKRRSEVKTEEGLKNVLAEFLKSRLNPFHSNTEHLAKKDKPRVIMIVGVNGAGKTTTIGKLAAKLQSEGSRVLVGACDTFRAAAVDQLQVWCDRAGADIMRAKDGADPSGVAYDTVARAQREGHDFCLVDTAGRLHTATGLMDELAKTKRVMSKVSP